jgi:hypothetical protein
MKVCPLYNADDKMAAKGSGPVLLEKLAKESIS